MLTFGSKYAQTQLGSAVISKLFRVVHPVVPLKNEEEKEKTE
jgi:hypothetical protein